jgi:MerR family transcriptional regulator, copper efflux regulator
LTKKPKEKRKISEYLTVKEAAEYLGVSVATLRNWDRSEKLKASRHPVNGYRLYDQRDLQRILEEIGNEHG